MNTFQQQYLSVLGAATGKKFLDAAEKAAGKKELLSQDKGAKRDAAKEWSNEYQDLSKESAKYLSNLELAEIDKDKGDTALKAFDELRNINKQQLTKINDLQRGWDADKAKELGMVSKLMSQGNAKRGKTIKQWYNDLTGGKK